MGRDHRASGRRTRSLRRRLLLFVLNTDPPVCGRARVLALPGVLLLALYPMTAGFNDSGSGWTMAWALDQNGRWTQSFSFYDQQKIDFSGYIRHERALGWERWTVVAGGPFASKGPSVPSAAVPQSKLDQLRRDGWQNTIDYVLTNRAGERHVTGLEMLRDGRSELVLGSMSWVRKYVAALGAAILILAYFVWVLRSLLRYGYLHRLALATEGRCPRCKYPLAGLPSGGTCPECGLDIPRDREESQTALGTSSTTTPLGPEPPEF